MEILESGDFDVIKENIDKIPDDLFFTLDPEKINWITKQLLKSGDTENANRLLRINGIKAEQHAPEFEKTRKKLWGYIDIFRLNATTEGLNGNYDEAIKLYNKAIDRAERSVLPIDKYIEILEGFLNFLKTYELDYNTESIEKKLEEAKKNINH